jgi:hypothetical protein
MRDQTYVSMGYHEREIAEDIAQCLNRAHWVRQTTET